VRQRVDLSCVPTVIKLMKKREWSNSARSPAFSVRIFCSLLFDVLASEANRARKPRCRWKWYVDDGKVFPVLLSGPFCGHAHSPIGINP